MDINRYNPSYGISKKHMTRISDFSTEEIFELLYAARAMKAKFEAHEDTRILKGTTVALLFGDTSLRTRSALEIGVSQLGGICVNLPYSENDMRAGENVKDIVNVISRYGVGALVTRKIAQSELESFCAVSPVSIINSMSQDGVPLQALCDIFTVWEKLRKLEGLKIAYVGKGTSNAASLITCAVKCGMEVAVATPNEFEIDRARFAVAAQFGNIDVTDNPVEAVKNADVIYTDNYNYHSPVSEKEKEILKPYQVNTSLMATANHNAQFMHALPANRGAEVTAEIIDGKNSLVLVQGENKLHTIKAALALLVK